MKRSIYLLATIFFLLITVGQPAYADELTVTTGIEDINVIPDIYNTGAHEPENGFVTVADGSIPCTIDGVNTTVNGATEDKRFVINVKYKHKNLNGEILIENVDLSEYTFAVYGADAIESEGRNLSFVFNNCKLKGIAGGRSSVKGLSFEFNNCSFLSASGSDITFNHCRFGGGITDRLNLFVNCYVNDCYIYNPTSYLAADGEIHVDGIQIYGNNTDSTVKTENIHFDNCRFELPALPYPNARKSYVNACIMLQTEFSDGDNMSFENCYLNGGGYAVYAHGVKGTKLSNITFKNLYFGCSSKFGKIYPDRPETDQINWNEDTWKDAASVYVGTVERNINKNETYISVSNDTNIKRYFRAYTSSGSHYDYEIEACPNYKEFYEKGMSFEEFPFDKLYTIPEYCDWVVVYEMIPVDGASESEMLKIRFMNWTEQKEVTIRDVSATNLSYAMSDDGTLTIDGFGNMPEFDEENKAPWYDEKDKTRKIVINSVTSVSKNAFADFINLEEVVINDKFVSIDDLAFSGCTRLSTINMEASKELKSIGEGAFKNCISLLNVKLPENIYTIGKDAFLIDKDAYKEFDSRRNVYFYGTLSKWISIAFSNQNSNPMYYSGGDLYVNGNEQVNSFSAKMVTKTVIGKAAFAGCTSIKTADFDGITEIGANAFEKSGVGGDIVICSTVKKVGVYAFTNAENIRSLVWEIPVAIPMGCFSNCTQIKDITLTGEASIIGNWAFKGCTNLETVTLSDTIANIYQQAFQNDVKLKSIKLPASLTNIGNYTFAGCELLTEVIFEGDKCPEIMKTAFNKVSKDELIFIIKDGASGFETNEVVEKTAGHVLSKKYIAAKSCIEPAKEQYICILHNDCQCNYEIVKESLEHTKAKAVREKEVKPTTRKAGKYDEVIYCSVCKKELSRKQKTIRKITVRKVSIKKLTKLSKNGKRSVLVQWDRKSDINGYEVQYSINRTFKSSTRTKVIKNRKISKCVISQLRKKRTYYVKIRSYKVVDGKKYKSIWSKVKRVRL